MTPDEEKKVKEAAIQYIKDTYEKDYVVKKIHKDRVFGSSYDIEGVIQDGKNTPVYITGTPGDFVDSYVSGLWTDELEPHITKLVKNTMDLRKIDHFSYSNGTAKTKYKGEIPSVFEALKKGEKDFLLNVRLEIYQHGGQEKEGISRLLKELQKMNFNDVSVTIFVYDDKLKSSQKNEDADNHLLSRYNISGDIQTMDLNNLDQYKTVIKH